MSRVLSSRPSGSAVPPGRLGLLLFASALFASLTVAAQKSPPPKAAAVKPPAVKAKKSALDKPALEAYIRHLFVWGPKIQVNIGDPKPAPLAGMYERSEEHTSELQSPTNL